MTTGYLNNKSLEIQLVLLNEVAEKELNKEIRKSDDIYQRESDSALDEVNGYTQFYSGPTQRSVSKQENKLNNISGDIGKETQKPPLKAEV
jgi:hypothetical protein